MEEFTKRKLEKFHEKEYYINSEHYKLCDSKEVLVVSDTHYHKNAPKETYNILVDYCRRVEPDFIVIPGDLLENASVINSKEDRLFIENIIRSMAEVAPVILTLGNHDIGNFNTKTFIKKSFDINCDAINYYSSLNKYKNVYVLNNEQVMIDGIMFLGFNPSLETYLKREDRHTAEILMNDYVNSGLKMNEKDYNVLVTHSPLNALNPNISIEDFNERTDLVITGHFHGGRLPNILKNHIKNTNIGLFFVPFAFPIPGIICRGIHDFGRGQLFISDGFRKWTADLKLFNLFEKITSNDVEKLIVSSGSTEKNKIKVIK